LFVIPDALLLDSTVLRWTGRRPWERDPCSDILTLCRWEIVENAVALIARFGVRFTSRQTLMPEFDQSPFNTNKSRRHRGPAPYIAGL
jgi:hypothetical protein